MLVQDPPAFQSSPFSPSIMRVTVRTIMLRIVSIMTGVDLTGLFARGTNPAGGAGAEGPVGLLGPAHAPWNMYVLSLLRPMSVTRPFR